MIAITLFQNSYHFKACKHCKQIDSFGNRLLDEKKMHTVLHTIGANIMTLDFRAISGYGLKNFF